jgi:uncharacterized protein
MAMSTLNLSESPMNQTARCPLCARPTQAEHKPFCSRGCKDRDLLNWLGEAYRVPARAAESEDEDTGLDIPPKA